MSKQLWAARAADDASAEAVRPAVGKEVVDAPKVFSLRIELAMVMVLGSINTAGGGSGKSLFH